ncbi:hypothetical protein [Enterobacter sp. EGD-HP1]|uniref:hypothetical protein n=1 Tax=Enterobacter sp. EGD-HP1 TaxID=1357268 RepID=UPI0012E2A31D|nr:hypothetical protein [Enterobacter sp. EGD-HP1]
MTFAYAPYDEITGYENPPLDGVRASSPDAVLIRINFGGTAVSFYNIILSVQKKIGSASTEIQAKQVYTV